jgi:histidine triad (HIT) family protein
LSALLLPVWPACESLKPSLPVWLVVVPMPTDPRPDCTFCRRYQDGEFIYTVDPEVISFEPLNPRVPGHMLFLPAAHLADAADDPVTTGQVFAAASRYADGQHEAFNLITSAGPAATQTVRHLHVHYVPRRYDDGLHLPWTNQLPGGGA